MPTINLDTILSDPLLVVAAALLVVSPILFIIAFWKFVKAKKDSTPFAIPRHEMESPLSSQPEDSASGETYTPYAPEPETPVEEVALNEPAPVRGTPIPMEDAPIIPTNGTRDAEKTVVMPAGMGEMQGQMEIAFSQIKNLNRKVYQLETELESVSRIAATKLDVNELKEAPMNPGDFTQKLLKLAEHVIVLEKEVARLKAGKPAVKAEASIPPTASTPKPLPPMPL